MDFFSHQDQARKKTKQLVFLFSLSVVALILLTNIALAALLWGFEHYGTTQAHALGTERSITNVINYFSHENFLKVTLAVCLFIFVTAGFKWLQLRGGGHSIAESLGGQLVNTDTGDFYQRRLLNIVEEMALASSMPVPAVYILKNEIGINAFAAGYQTSDAVIGVTAGAIEKLSRKQLQGIIGHEFSHILNGDMRLNIRLIAVLHGILCISYLGEEMLHLGGHNRYGRSSSSKDSAGFFAVGLTLMVVGYIGVFFGKLIKSAVSRQREFLADAQAVQFTRDPSAVGEALKVIGYKGVGSSIGHAKKQELSHLFFGSAAFYSLKAFATHPPLEERISRIDQNWDGAFIAPQSPEQRYQEKSAIEQAAKGPVMTGLAAAMAASISLEPQPSDSQSNSTPQDNTKNDYTPGVGPATTDEEIKTALSKIEHGCHETFSAQSIVLASLIADKKSLVHEKQLDLIQQQLGGNVLFDTKKYYQLLHLANQHQYLPLIETCIASLKALSEPQFKRFAACISDLVKADGKIDIFEWCLYRLVLQYLSPQFNPVKPIKAKYGKVEKLSKEVNCILSFVAFHGHNNSHQAQESFNQGALKAGLTCLTYENPSTSFQEFNQAIKQLTHAYPHVKARLLKALAACVQHMGTQPIERDLVTTIAALLESPVPDLFADN